MVGYDSSNLHNKLKSEDFMVAGGAAGFVTRLLCQPLDVIKIRFQLQVEPLSRYSKESKYHGLFQSTHVIVKEEGLKALWKGHVSAQLLSVVYGVVGFSTFEYFTKQFIVTIPRMKDNSFVHLVCGGASNGLATLASFPFDTVRTRFVGQGTIPVYSGLFNAFKTILKLEGFSSFYRGLSPTIIQTVPHGGAQFACYDIISKILKKNGYFVLDNQYVVKNETKYLTPFGTFIAGSLAGAIAKTVVYPFDLARKRLQIQGQYNELRKGFGKNFVCSGLFQCLTLTYQNEGVTGLFKGLMPSILKATVSTSIHFAVYEQILVYLAVSKSRKEAS